MMDALEINLTNALEIVLTIDYFFICQTMSSFLFFIVIVTLANTDLPLLFFPNIRLKLIYKNICKLF